jgi:hypothetical protein
MQPFGRTHGREREREREAGAAAKIGASILGGGRRSPWRKGSWNCCVDSSSRGAFI